MKLRLRIDDLIVEAETGATVLQAAGCAGIKIPTLCHHPALEPCGACRLCSVEIEKNGRKSVVTSCNYPVEAGLVVRTYTPDIADLRKMILEMLLSRCPGESRIRELAQEYGIKHRRFNLGGERCVLCGLCTRVCDEIVGVAALSMTRRGVDRKVDTPYGDFSEDCIGCGSCALVCPTSAVGSMRNVYTLTADDIRQIEEIFLDGERDADIGVCGEIVAGRAAIPGQDGGMATSILAAGMEMGIFDAAVVVMQEEGGDAQAVVIDDSTDVIKSGGTKYQRVSPISQLMKALEDGKRRVAVVATPCQVRAIRKMQLQGSIDDKFSGAEVYLLGLFCFESFDRRRLKPRIKEIMGIDIDDADKIQIKKGKFIATLGESDLVCDVRDLDCCVSDGCRYCDDFVSRYADISIGSVGSPDGYSTAVVRSSAGQKMLSAVPFEKADVERKDIARLARLKRRNARERLAIIKEGLPSWP